MTAPVLIVLAALVVFALGAIAGRSVTSSRISQNAWQQALTYQDNVLLALDRALDGDLDGAYDALSELARKQDASPELYFALAALMRTMGRNDRSAQIYRTILARPGLSKELSERARIGLAQQLVALGRGEEAKPIIDSLPRRVRSDAGLLVLRKEAALQSRDWSDALSAGRALVKTAGGDGRSRADVFARIAEEAAAQGDLVAAQKGYRKALRAQPDSVRARLGLARLYLEEGKETKARRQLMATLQSNPALAPLILPQLRTLISQGGTEDESRFVELLEELESHPGVRLWVTLERVDRLYQQNMLDECRDLLEQLIDDYPRSVEVHEAFLNLLLELEDGKRLQRELERFIDLAAEEIRRFRCGHCGYLSATPFMECPNCRTVGELVYET